MTTPKTGSRYIFLDDAARHAHGADSQEKAATRPPWTLTKLASDGTVVIRFFDHTPTHEIPIFFAAISEMMPAQNANVIFDLRELVSHNPDTKEYAKRWLLENKSRLAQVTVVVAKTATILKMATAVVGLASGVKIRLRDDLGVGEPVSLL